MQVTAKVLIGGLILTGGCLPVPTLGLSHNRQTDFGLVGDVASNRPIEPGASRAQVERLLGDPPLKSADGRVIAYANTTTDVEWVWPELLIHFPAHQSGQSVRLTFDRNDRLARADRFDATYAAPWFPIPHYGNVWFSLEDEMNEGAVDGDRVMDEFSLETAARAVAATRPTSRAVTQSAITTRR